MLSVTPVHRDFEKVRAPMENEIVDGRCEAMSERAPSRAYALPPFYRPAGRLRARSNQLKARRPTEIYAGKINKSDVSLPGRSPLPSLPSLRVTAPVMSASGRRDGY